MIQLTDKDIAKLSQLDRIEFRQRWDRITCTILSISWLYIFIFCCALSIILYAITQNQEFYRQAIFLFVIAIYMWIISVVELCIKLKKQRVHRQHLLDEYFIINIKKQRAPKGYKGRDNRKQGEYQ